MPGSNERALEKAKTLEADCLIFDLEDAVAVSAKSIARNLTCQYLSAGGYGERELIIRINPLASAAGEDDLKAALRAKPDAILLPKVESAKMVQDLVQKMTHFDKELDAEMEGEFSAGKKTKIWCMMETPRGMLRAEEIAGASDLISAFVMGTSDLVKDLRAKHTSLRLPVITSLGLCMLAARAEGLDIIDGVYLDLEGDEAYYDACLQGLEMGFDGKSLIHPKQIAAANQIFTPTKEEIIFAQKIIAASLKADEEGRAVVVVEGKLIEHLHVEDAKRLILKAEMIRTRM
jgi:citrate lyase subunit beta/citryl-CoA lyase